MAVHRSRGFAYLVLLALLILPLPTSGQLFEADGLISLSAPAVGWVVQFLSEGYTLSAQLERQDGRGLYYMFTHATTGLNVSFYIQPAEHCTTGEGCRETSWQNRSPVVADAQLVGRFERNGFACLEYLTRHRLTNLPGGKVEQHHVSGHLVRDGYWVDMHLSMMPYAAKDRQVFLDFLDAIRVEAKAE